MYTLNHKTIRFSLITLFLFYKAAFCMAQPSDSIAKDKKIYFRGNGSITNNGFSFIPAFSLGKPAAIFNFNIHGGNRLSFDPEFRFSLVDGRPWSFIFIWRYKLINHKKFQTSFGMHYPAVPFRVLAYETTPEIKNTLAVSRVIPFELMPNYIINKYNSINIFCLYAKGVSDDAINNTLFLSLRSVHNIPIGKNGVLRLNPQAFYLRLDDKDGFYFAANTTLLSKKSPFYIGSTINKPLHTTIPGKTFNWTIHVGYTLDRKLIMQK